MVDMSGATAPTTHVVDVTDADFEQVVIQGSMQRPVVVDMWASWCAPCRTLGPTLEKVARERDGAFLLAKLDVDANAVGNALLQAVQSQGIPTVVAFSGGQPVNMFIGAYPEQEVNRFIDEILPTEVEMEADEALAEEAAGDLESAEQGYRDVIAKDPGNRDAAIGLARILLARGDIDEARALAEPLGPDADADRIMATVRVHDWGSAPGEGAIGAARAAAAAGRWREALDGLLGAFDDDPDTARASMVDIFTTLGDDAIVGEYRPKLAARLF